MKEFPTERDSERFVQKMDEMSRGETMDYDRKNIKRKKKRNKKNPIKKRHFISFFLRIWIPFLFMSLIFLYLFFTLYGSYIADANMRMQENQFSIFLNSTMDEVNDAYINGKVPNSYGYFTTDADAQYWAEIQFRVALTGCFGPTSLYKLDESNHTYTPIMDSLQRYYMMVRIKGMERFYFSCDKEIIDNILLSSDLNLSEKDIKEGNLYITFDDFYVKGSRFYPGTEIKVYSQGAFTIGFGESFVSAENFDHYIGTIYNTYSGPGYEYVKVGKGVEIAIAPILLGSEQTPEELWNMVSKRSGELVDFGERLFYDSDFTIYYGETGGFITYNLGYNSFSRVMYAGAQHKLKAVSVSYFDVMKECGPLFLIIAVIVFVIDLVISFFISRSNYKDYNARYRMEQFRKEMTDSLAHDLKSPLMAISGYAENLKANTQEEKKDYYLESIMDTVGYMNEILSDMFELDALESNENKMVHEQVDLLRICESKIEQSEKMITDKHLTVSVSGNAVMSGDSYYMKRVIDNLFDNALKYTPDGEEIRIQLSEYRFEIINTGVTIPKEQIDEICKPFVKGNKERSNQNGTGLGLSIVKTILSMHNLELKIESEDNVTKFGFDLY